MEAGVFIFVAKACRFDKSVRVEHLLWTKRSDLSQNRRKTNAKQTKSHPTLENLH